ncbi:hypothetical protein [Virgibacillus chiguensis]|uniref:hypothetical protein n=1 Tax=Virgibacillus chiguensis TaxID=411959 RepID=UPI000A0707BC|nr:hypothetical protein [Virgibacillus chiguensis]
MNKTKDKLLKLKDSFMDEYKRLDSTYYFNSRLIGFLSLGNPEQRAIVVPITANNLSSLFRKMIQEVEKKTQANRNFKWVKVDIAKNFNIQKFRELNLDILKTKKNYFRKGISLDLEFKYALLEQELNGNAILSNVGKSSELAFNLDNLASYFAQSKAVSKGKQINMDDDVVVFNTDSKFIDNCVVALEDSYYEHGFPKVEKLTKKEIVELITHSSDYLADQVQINGKFVYGYFSSFDKQINFYNSLRHASTVYSMIEGYEVNPKKSLKMAIEKAVNYLTHELIRENEWKNEAYVIDWENHNEIKLGANAAAILALTKYASVFKSRIFQPLCEKLANAIVSFQLPDGNFNHVYTYPSLELKEKFRIIYYDGEAAFSLMKLYQLDHNPKWLLSVEKAFDFFIQHKYWENHDHWLAYCTNELTKIRPEDKYFEFGLLNVTQKLNFIFHRKTTYPTFLELTLASYEMIRRIQKLKREHLLTIVSVKELIHVINKRALYQLNGYFYASFAMYFKNPKRILHAFFIRHQSFRVRIDDVEHNISGYRRYLDWLDELGENANEKVE